MLKVMTILGTRPEIIRLSEVIKRLNQCFHHVLVHTGQNWDYTLNEIFFKELDLKEPDYYLDCVGKNLGETMGNIIAKSYTLLQNERPDAVLILGDTNSALSAIAAKRLKIPIFHMEAGNRCFDQNVPEEINRKIVDHIADVNLPYTEHSRRYLIEEGYAKERIFVTGSPMTEVLQVHKRGIESSNILTTLGLQKNKYIVVSAHREENIDDELHFYSLMNALNEIAEIYQIPVLYSTHPRSKGYIEKRKFVFHPLIQNHAPLGFLDYNQLQRNAKCVLSDSGTLSEEASILGFVGVLLRTSTERPEAVDKGNVVIGNVTGERMKESIALACRLKEQKIMPNDYMDESVSSKIAVIIQSYTPIVNEMVWRKNTI